jgi:hypothetical protein
MILFALCLLGACAVHVADLWQHGWLPYHFAPFPLNAYWTVLTFLDPIAAALLLLRPRTGLAFALLIIASDVMLNLFARFYLHLHLHSFALSLQMLFLVAIVATTFHARRTGAATLTI